MEKLNIKQLVEDAIQLNLCDLNFVNSFLDMV